MCATNYCKEIEDGPSNYGCTINHNDRRYASNYGVLLNRITNFQFIRGILDLHHEGLFARCTYKEGYKEDCDNRITRLRNMKSVVE